MGGGARDDLGWALQGCGDHHTTSLLCSCWLRSETGLLHGVTANSSRLTFRWPAHSGREGMWLSQEDSAEVPRVALIGPDG